MTTLHPRVSVNTISTWNWTLDQDIAFLKRIGAGVFNPPMLKFADDPAAGIEKIKAAGLFCCSISGGGREVLVDSEERTLAGLRPYIDAASALGAPSLYFVTGPTPPDLPMEELHRRFVATLGPAKAHAAEKGVRLAIEHNSPASHDIGAVHSLADAIEVCTEAGIGICVEFQNCWVERGLERMFRDHVDLFTVVQVSDFRPGEELRFNRRVPGDGAMPLEWMIGAMLDAGYQGYFDLELLGPAIEAEGYESAIRRSVDWLSDRLSRWGA